MPLPWKKSISKPGRISRFVSDLQQSPKRRGSLVVETGFPTSLIDLFVKNRDRLKKSPSKRNNNKAQTQTVPTRRSVLSPPLPPLPQKLDPTSVTEDLTAASKIEESHVGVEKIDNGGDNDGNGDRRGGGGSCVLTVVVIKVFVVAVLALSTKKLALGITLSAFSLLFLELAVSRLFTRLNLFPDAAQFRLHSLIGRNRKEKLEESSSTTQQERQNKVSFEIIEESRDGVEETSTLDVVQAIRDVVITKEKSKSAKLKSKIVKKIVPKKLRSYKKKRKAKIREKEQQAVYVVEEEEEESLTEVSSLYSEDHIIESKLSEGDEIGSNPPLLESCEEMEGEEEEESKGDLTKAIVMIVISMAGLLSGKVFAIGLTLSSCLILRLVCCKSQTTDKRISL